MFYLADWLVSDRGRLSRTAYTIASKSHVLLDERAKKIVVMMAQSCYNPEEALKVSVDDMKIRPMLIQGRWDRMAKADQSATPQFLSTHPTVSCKLAIRSLSLESKNFRFNAGSKSTQEIPAMVCGFHCSLSKHDVGST